MGIGSSILNWWKNLGLKDYRILMLGLDNAGTCITIIKYSFLSPKSHRGYDKKVPFLYGLEPVNITVYETKYTLPIRITIVDMLAHSVEQRWV